VHRKQPSRDLNRGPCPPVRPSVSISLATYNGAPYLKKQIDSILEQVGSNAEIVVVDDSSTDETIRILEEIRDERIRIIRQERNRGVVKTFERAVMEATGDVIFLCDQDDIWLPEKVETVLRTFAADKAITLVISNGSLIDATGRSVGRELYNGDRIPLGFLSNLIKNRYQGSAMAFRREILEAALPFPARISMHDSWIGLVNAIVGRAEYIPAKLILYRQHENNVTARHHGPVHRMVVQRWRLAVGILARLGLLLRIRRDMRRQLGVPHYGPVVTHVARKR